MTTVRYPSTKSHFLALCVSTAGKSHSEEIKLKRIQISGIIVETTYGKSSRDSIATASLQRPKSSSPIEAICTIFPTDKDHCS